MICIECVTPEPLKKLFDTHGQEGDCQYCQRHGKAIESRVLFEYVYDRVRENLAQRDDLSHFELGMLYECGSDKIAMAGIDEVLSERMKLGEERYFDLLVDGVPEEFVADDDGHEVHFFDDDGTLEKNVYDEEWDAFVSGVQYTHRFFNANAKEFLDSVFSPL